MDNNELDDVTWRNFVLTGNPLYFVGGNSENVMGIVTAVVPDST